MQPDHLAGLRSHFLPANTPTTSQDGHFGPNLTLGPPIVASLRKHTDAFLDCHLMVSKPQQWVEDFAQAGGFADDHVLSTRVLDGSQ